MVRWGGSRPPFAGLARGEDGGRDCGGRLIRLRWSMNALLHRLAETYNILYIHRMKDLKPVEFRGSSLDDLRAFPLPARREAGHQLDQVQHDREPDDWKPMNTVGQGVKEIRIRDAAGAFRVIYVAKLADAVYVLHCFQKKTEKTSKVDLDLAAKRYRELRKELGR